MILSDARKPELLNILHINFSPLQVSLFSATAVDGRKAYLVETTPDQCE